MENWIDIRMALSMIGTAWQFYGVVEDGTEACWDDVTWVDERPKPTWDEILVAHAAWKLLDAQQKFKTRMDEAFTGEMEEYTDYPIRERETWPFLVPECRAYVDSNGTMVGPLLSGYPDGIGTLQDGVTPADTLDAFVASVLAKHGAWAELSGKLLAQRRTLSARLQEILDGMAADPPTYTQDDLDAFVDAATLDL